MENTANPKIVSEKKFISVVLYLHNNETGITSFLENALCRIRERFENLELVCVDDDCTDATLDRLKEFLTVHPEIGAATIVRMGSYQGLEPCMNAGRDISIGDFVYEFDTTCMDYDSEMIEKAYEAISSGADIAIVAPKDKTKLSSRVFYGIYNRFSRSPVKICSDTFRIISRRAINRIKSISDFIPYRKALYANCGLRAETLYYRSNGVPRERAEKKTYERVNLAFDSFIYFTDFLEKVSSCISAFFLLFSVGSVAYAMWDYFANGSAIEGWTSIICFMSFGFFGVFVLLTIILKYLSVILNLVFRRQKYLVASIEKAGGNQ